MNNADLSLHVFAFLKKAGMESLVICAGARNAPMVMLLKEQNFQIYSFFEERSAAFFALGLMKSTNKPVAVLTTSGTAAAELLPATIEAFYQNLPLVLITADRPKSYRGSGSPQAIEQPGLYSHYVEKTYDLDAFSKNFEFEWSLRCPIHINISFDEPLIDKPMQKTVAVDFIKTENSKFFSTKKQIQSSSFQKPLIILGEIPIQYRKKVVEFLKKIKAPIYAESLSLLRHHNELESLILRSSEHLIKTIFKEKFCDAVIRIGNVPTLRFWRDLEKEFHHIPVTSYSDIHFSGLARPSQVLAFAELPELNEYSLELLLKIKEVDTSLLRFKNELLQKYPQSEQSLTACLSELCREQPVYLGNSMPIRYWDEFSAFTSGEVAANRGANGIDGQISTYLGWSEKLKKSYCYVGDLTALYDLAALGLTAQLIENSRNILIMNNRGGQIFNRVFKNKDFINEHKINFQNWAFMWGWSYTQISSVADLEKLRSLNSLNNIIELFPDNQQTEDFWIQWDRVCSQQKF